MAIQRTLKRRRVDDGDGMIADSSNALRSMQRNVSPPARASPVAALPVSGAGTWSWPKDLVTKAEPEKVVDGAAEEFDHDDTVDDTDGDTESEDENGPPTVSRNAELKVSSSSTSDTSRPAAATKTTSRCIRSPFQLTKIQQMPAANNVDTVSLHDILGHPLLTECWQFNFLLSIPFILEHFDPDTRQHIDLKIVHGFWRNDDQRKQKLQEQQEQAVNAGNKVQLIAAHMPEMFGTHHSKMMILVRADGVAQVVIHTANMIPQDWANMTQAVWRSPELPLLPDHEQGKDDWEGEHAIGSGLRFKADLLKYLGAYEGRTRSLVNKLKKYDFSSIKAALISSTPSKLPPQSASSKETTAFGWLGVKQILSKVPAKPAAITSGSPVINIQVSSIATLTDNWTQNFCDVLNTYKKSGSNIFGPSSRPQSKVNIIFPTAEEIRKSIDGYSSGDSIHMKIQKPAQQKQLQSLKLMLHHWHGEITSSSVSDAEVTKRKALRNAAAPHIKTYIRFSDVSQKTIDWAMITSANLSQQAWGATTDKNRLVRIASYEIGVVIWPELFKDEQDEEAEVLMVPTFGKDTPEVEDAAGAQVVVGVRMPYDLPLVPYAKDDVPLVASMAHTEPDWMGNRWGGYEDRM